MSEIDKSYETQSKIREIKASSALIGTIACGVSSGITLASAKYFEAGGMPVDLTLGRGARIAGAIFAVTGAVMIIARGYQLEKLSELTHEQVSDEVQEMFPFD